MAREAQNTSINTQNKRKWQKEIDANAQEMIDDAPQTWTHTPHNTMNGGLRASLPLIPKGPKKPQAQENAIAQYNDPLAQRATNIQTNTIKSPLQLALQGNAEELQRYQKLLSSVTEVRNSASSYEEELKIAPLICWNIKTHLTRIQSQSQSSFSGTKPSLQQYASLGQVISGNTFDDVDKPVLLNTNAPWSAFLCGSQGSGKSHALSCMLENCLLRNNNIGKNPNPLAGLVFHYDSHQGSGICEAAYLCSAVPTTVLVSESNYQRLKRDYEAMARQHGGIINVQVMKLLPSHLDTERMKTLMGVGQKGELPLYMQLVIKVLRCMAIECDQAIGKGNTQCFDYTAFKKHLSAQGFSDGQTGPLNMRLALLDSFINSTSKPGADVLIGRPGTLTIIDLTDPVVDADAACVLFDICLSIFIANTKCAKIVALDEAHNYMTEESSAAQQFTTKLLKTIREQRHQATRVVIATQEPSINTGLLDLCSITMVHRCSSPAWFSVLKKHVAGLFLNGNSVGEGESESKGEADKKIFQQIVQLKLGESLLFCPTAAVGVDRGEVVRMVDGFVKFKTRARVTADGGRTRLADEG